MKKFLVAFLICFSMVTTSMDADAAKRFGGGSARFFVKQQRSVADTEGFVQEMMNGQKVIKVFCHEAQSIEDFDRINDKLCDDSFKAHTYAGILGPIIGNIGNILYVVLALVGGVLGMNSYDPQIKNSLEIAKEKGIQVEFEGGDLGDVHPNTVRITAYTTDGQMTSLTGSSVGGGNIEIIDINGTAAKFTGRYPAVIINHYDRLGIISHLTSILAINQINIATVVNSRDATGKNAVTMIETESPVDSAVKKELESMPPVKSVVTMDKVN